MYKVPNWKYNGNKIEIDSAALREINRKYDGNRVEIDFAALACGRQAKGIVPNSLRLCSLPRRITGRLVFFILAKTQRRKGIERSFTNLSPAYPRQGTLYLVLGTSYFVRSSTYY